MHCLFCGAHDTKVIDSRLIADGSQVRRRRECLVCRERMTTFEIAQWVMPQVVKQDGSRVPFDEAKLRRGMEKALEKRPVQVSKLDTAIHRLTQEIRSLGEREISSRFIGEQIMSALRALDEVAYVRFASVYRSFQCISEFKQEIARLEAQEQKPANKIRQEEH